MNRMERFFLWTGAFGWGMSILGVLLPWRVIEPLMLNMGMSQPLADPQLHYWFRMATGGWTVIGFLFLMTALFPERYRNLIPLLAFGSLFEGLELLIHGLWLNRPALPFYGDVGFCLLVGTGLLYSLCQARRHAESA